jgi:hypothetical protein
MADRPLTATAIKQGIAEKMVIFDDVQDKILQPLIDRAYKRLKTNGR